MRPAAVLGVNRDGATLAGAAWATSLGHSDSVTLEVERVALVGAEAAPLLGPATARVWPRYFTESSSLNAGDAHRERSSCRRLMSPSPPRFESFETGTLAGAPTVRSLAKALNLSPTTVSEALRGVPRVSLATRELVRAAADAASYRLNPLASAVMSEIRRSRRGFRGTIAATSLDEADRPVVANVFFRGIVNGARRRAGELGFSVECFVVGQRGVRLPRLDTILQSRGIRGLILLPAWDTPDFTKLDWSRYTGVYTDYIIERPALNAVCADHYRSLMVCLQRLHALGYRRPGLFLQRQQDERLQFRWESGFRAFQDHAKDVEAVPLLIEERIDQDTFSEWFERHQPDVVLGHDCAALEWMRACGADVPRTHGFFCLNMASCTGECAGLDQQPELIGARAAEMVIGQLQHNVIGIPDTPSLTTLLGRWVDGQTLRATDVGHKEAQKVGTRMLP